MDFVINEDTKPLKFGRIILVRFIRSNLLLDVFGEKFLMPKYLVYSYIIVIIEIESETILVIRDEKIEWQTHYKIN